MKQARYDYSGVKQGSIPLILGSSHHTGTVNIWLIIRHNGQR